mgnify:CR=1 FL=1
MEAPVVKRGRPAKRIAPAAIVARRRWEYTTLSSERSIRAIEYDQYGADGWELVSVYVRMDAVHAVFKREVV